MLFSERHKQKDQAIEAWGSTLYNRSSGKLLAPSRLLQMPIPPNQTTYFKQVRFATRLPNHYRYSPAHYWIAEQPLGVLRVGLTKFAARMLGDFVEITFNVENGDEISQGEPIGSLEGFKAISDIYSIGTGHWRGVNPEIQRQPEQVDKDPYDQGWLYEMSGDPNESWMDVHEYISLLDATISQMLESEEKNKESQC